MQHVEDRRTHVASEKLYHERQKGNVDNCTRYRAWSSARGRRARMPFDGLDARGLVRDPGTLPIVRECEDAMALRPLAGVRHRKHKKGPRESCKPRTWLRLRSDERLPTYSDQRSSVRGFEVVRTDLFEEGPRDPVPAALAQSSRPGTPQGCGDSATARARTSPLSANT